MKFFGEGGMYDEQLVTFWWLSGFLKEFLALRYTGNAELYSILDDDQLDEGIIFTGLTTPPALHKIFW